MRFDLFFLFKKRDHIVRGLPYRYVQENIKIMYKKGDGKYCYLFMLIYFEGKRLQRRHHRKLVEGRHSWQIVEGH